MSLRWPRTVPILEASDIHKGTMTSEDGKRHCIIGWAVQTFKNGNQRDRIEELIKIEIGSQDIVHWNDSHYTSRPQIAKVWNAVMNKIGYTEVTNT